MDQENLPNPPEDTNAQVEQTAAQTPASNESTSGHQSPGLQKRIDELVAEQHEWRRRFEAEQSQKQELLSALLSQQTQRASAPDPYAGIEVDPDDRKKVEAVMHPTLRMLQDQQRQMQELLVRTRARDVANSVGDPRVTDMAEKLAATWSQRGLDGWTPEDAVTMAIGLVAREERSRNTGRPGRVAPGEAPVITQQAGMAPARSSKRPANFDSLSLDKQLEIWEQEGIEDIPL